MDLSLLASHLVVGDLHTADGERRLEVRKAQQGGPGAAGDELRASDTTGTQQEHNRKKTVRTGLGCLMACFRWFSVSSLPLIKPLRAAGAPRAGPLGYTRGDRRGGGSHLEEHGALLGGEVAGQDVPEPDDHAVAAVEAPVVHRVLPAGRRQRDVVGPRVRQVGVLKINPFSQRTLRAWPCK